MNNEAKKRNENMETITEAVQKYIKGENAKNVISDSDYFGDIFMALTATYQLNDGIFERISPFISDEANCVMREIERTWN